MELVRGHPAIEAHLRAHTVALRRFLKSSVGDATASETERPTELASILILNAFRQKSDGLFFEADRLRQLARILREYLSVLNGETLVRGDKIPPIAGEPAKQPGLIERNFAFVVEYWQFIVPFVLIAFVALFAEHIWRLMNFVLRGLVNFRLLTLVRESEDFLQFLYYTEGREASSGFSFQGLSFGGKRVLSARALTLQGLTDRYLGYVRKVREYYNGKLIIVIDELDKITDPKEVRDVLLEIKGALFEKGCFYLISISEDSARAFRGRLSEGRDIFESTFDDVLVIDQMDHRIAAEMVRHRLKSAPDTPKLAEDAILILTVFAGGIPREIVRNLRIVTLAAGSRRRIGPRDVGTSLFRAAVVEWMGHLAEIPTWVVDAIALRNNAQVIVAALEALKTSSPWPGSIRDRLERSVAILDPGNLRLKPRPNLAEKTEANAYLGVIREVQYCFRLMIMDCLLEKFWRKDPGWQECAPAALECFRVLMDQPALAEAMIHAMRTGKLPTRHLAAE